MPTQNLPYLLSACLLLLAVTGCQRDTPSPPVLPDEPVKEISWFKGSVTEAFATAKAEDKPVFLYWGAIWCPPCQEIKHTVFKSSDFIALSELFIPVYLDGDTEQAQQVGEEFGVKGYPTMIVFNPAGDEVTRIPGGIDISRYNTILGLALNKLTPTSRLVELAISNPTSLSTDDFTQLAFYSWGQDFNTLPEDAPVTLFADLGKLAADKNPVAGARLYMQYLVDEAGKDDKTARITDALPWLEKILASNELTLATWDSLVYWPEVTDILKIEDADRRQINEQWQAQTMALRHSASLSTAEQLAGWLPTLFYYFKQDKQHLDPALATTLMADIQSADKATRNNFARQSVIYQASVILQRARLTDEARTLLLAELERSPAPYYFMSSLGSLEEKQDNHELAIDWFRKAYETSGGTATRFQWGASYVRALIRMQPEAQALIGDTAKTVFKELGNDSEVFTGRNFRVLRSLNKQLNTWYTDQGEPNIESRLSSRIKALCASQPDASLARQNCQSLLQATQETSD